MEMKDIKVLVIGEFNEINRSLQNMMDVFNIQCDVVSIDDAEEMIFTGNYTHIIAALAGDNDKEKGRLFYNLLKIRLPGWKKNAKLFKASISDITSDDHIRLNFNMLNDIKTKIIMG